MTDPNRKIDKARAAQMLELVRKDLVRFGGLGFKTRIEPTDQEIDDELYTRQLRAIDRGFTRMGDHYNFIVNWLHPKRKW